MMPTNVISWEVSLSNLICSFSMLPDVLWFFKIPYAMVCFFASSGVTVFPVFALTAAAASGELMTTSLPLTRYAPFSYNFIVSSLFSKSWLMVII